MGGRYASAGTFHSLESAASGGCLNCEGVFSYRGRTLTGYSHLHIIHTIGIFTDVLSGDNKRDGIYTAGEAMRSVRRGELEGASLDV